MFLQVWKEISDDMHALEYAVSDQQCWTKWKALKCKYKQVEKCNKKSGNGRKIWEHFEVKTSATFANFSTVTFSTGVTGFLWF